MVDRTALEMRSTGNRIGGSNPSLSATVLYNSANWARLTVKEARTPHVFPIRPVDFNFFNERLFAFS